MRSGTTDKRPPELAFTLARGQNHFFVELAEALVYELRQLDVSATIHVGRLPAAQHGLVHVFLPPHEYVALSGYRPSAQLLRRSIVISAEQPGSHFFQANTALARDAGAVFDINPRAVRAYREHNIDASYLALGHSRLWDRFSDNSRRDIDILFIGRLTSRRAIALASYADVFERFRCHLLLSDNSRPNASGNPSFLTDKDKRDLMARSKVLLNVHGEDESYFEWLRVAEAICAGCAIASEHSTDLSPLQPGRDIATARLESLDHLCAWLLHDSSRHEEMAANAYSVLVRERPMSRAAEQLADAALELDRRALDPIMTIAVKHEALRQRRNAHLAPPALHPPDRPSVSDGEALLLRAVKNQQLAITGLRRRLERFEVHARADHDSHAQVTWIAIESSAWRVTSSRLVTVVIPLYNHATEVLDALASVERSPEQVWEIVVVDDGSTDSGADAVSAWIEARQHLPCKLVRHAVNRGLAAARNTGVEHATTDRLLMLDADNELRPIAIERLMKALANDSSASFAYGIMEKFSPDGSLGLLSAHGWDPERFRSGNYIDALSLIRRQDIMNLGGYSTDPRLYGWEDYDLWARIAEGGGHGAFVPEIIARYRVGHSSMISHTNVSTADAYAAVADHAPNLMRDLVLPR